MSNGSRLIRFALPCVCLLAFVVAAGGETYKIVLTRPTKMGQTYTISAKGESTQNMTINLPNGPQKQGESFTTQLEGTIKVLAVDEASGEPSKLECTVSKLTKSDKPVLDSGTVVTAEHKGKKTVYTVNDMPVDPATDDVLGVVLSVHQIGAPTDNKVFGTTTPQEIGGTWPIDSAAAAEGAAQSGLAISKDEIKGESKLVAVTKVDGKDALEVHAEMNVEKLDGVVVDGNQITSGSMKAQFEGVFPADESVQPLSQSQKMEMHMKMSVKGPDGNAILVDADMNRSMKAKFGPTHD